MEPVSRDGIPRVLFAGEATEPRAYSTVHGARWVLRLRGRPYQKIHLITFSSRLSGLREAHRIAALYPKWSILLELEMVLFRAKYSARNVTKSSSNS